jgi:hypothetical protein
MPDKFANLLDSTWRKLLLWLLAAFKSAEFVRGFLRGTDAWLDQSITMLLFFSACVLANRRDLAANKTVRGVRATLLMLVALSLVWSTLRTTHRIVADRMEHDRLIRIHNQMKRSETHRLGPIYRRYQRAANQLHCQTNVPLNHARCDEISQRMDEIGHFRVSQPEQSETAQALREALRARQEKFREILNRTRPISTSLPEPVDFPISRKDYGYWETMQWMRNNPMRIEVQAVIGSLLSHGLVLTTAMLLAFILDLFRRPATSPPPAAVPTCEPVAPAEPRPASPGWGDAVKSCAP